MNPNNLYRIYVDKETKEVVMLSVNNIESRYPAFDTIEDAYKFAHNLQKICLEAKINMEVYNGLDEAKSDRRLHDVRNSSN